MSTKGTELTPVTRQKISLAKVKHSKASLIKAGQSYIESIFDDEGKFQEVPSVVSFCLQAGISRSRLYELSAEHSEVSDIVEFINMLQEKLAISEGFRGKASIFSMFLLKAKHDYKDQPQQLTQNNNFNISPDLLADALAIMNKDKK